ncbi:magnesium transporter [Thalassotalea fonticola]|uniref:Magnesium transporter n=1 Tax=Thalassotalea fonticola TaxID=3065649 RepID=A0ABZ0GRL5_9GAMM|nr:magnesium transporter [Colwelliaceae bacterium S1-1]
MSEVSTVEKTNKSLGMKIISFIVKAVIFIVVVGAIAKALSFLGEIHGKDLPESYFSDGYPTILGLLDSEIFMGLIFFITLSVFAYIGYLLWELHEVAVHKAEANASPQLQLVFALSLCGLFIHKAWWVLAIIIAFTSWSHIGDWLSNIIHKDNRSAEDNKENK